MTISYNQSRHLRRCLDSVKGQTFSDYEHLIVDPGSTDGSREMIEVYPNPRILKVYKRDTSPAEGLNNGFEQAKSPIVIYLNADDELAPGALAKFVELHETYSQADVIIGNGWLIDEFGCPIAYSRSDRFSPVRAAMGVGTVLQQATSYRLSALPKPRPFNEDNKYTWDLELLCDLYAHGATLVRVDETLGYFRQYADTITGRADLGPAIKRERNAVLDPHLGRRLPLLQSLSLPARVVKRCTLLAYLNRHNTTFPGLVTTEVD